MIHKRIAAWEPERTAYMFAARHALGLSGFAGVHAKMHYFLGRAEAYIKHIITFLWLNKLSSVFQSTKYVHVFTPSFQ